MLESASFWISSFTREQEGWKDLHARLPDQSRLSLGIPT